MGEPPNSIGVFYNYRWPPKEFNKTILSPETIKRETFMLCSATRTINEAATLHKSTACNKREEPNLDKTKKIADLFSKRIRDAQLSTARTDERKYRPMRTDF